MGSVEIRQARLFYQMTPNRFMLDAQGNAISRHAGYKHGDGKEREREIQQALARARVATLGNRTRSTGRPVPGA